MKLYLPAHPLQSFPSALYPSDSPQNPYFEQNAVQTPFPFKGVSADLQVLQVPGQANQFKRFLMIFIFTCDLFYQVYTGLH